MAIVSSGQVMSGGTISSSTLVYPGGSSASATVANDGFLLVEGGGSAVGTVVNSGGFLQILSGGRATGTAVVVCPYDLFEVRKIDKADFQSLTFIGKVKNRVHRGMVAYTPNADQCRACGLCIEACPEGAIKLIKAGLTTATNQGA